MSSIDQHDVIPSQSHQLSLISDHEASGTQNETRIPVSSMRIKSDISITEDHISMVSPITPEAQKGGVTRGTESCQEEINSESLYQEGDSMAWNGHDDYGTHHDFSHDDVDGNDEGDNVSISSDCVPLTMTDEDAIDEIEYTRQLMGYVQGFDELSVFNRRKVQQEESREIQLLEPDIIKISLPHLSPQGKKLTHLRPPLPVTKPLPMNKRGFTESPLEENELENRLSNMDCNTKRIHRRTRSSEVLGGSKHKTLSNDLVEKQPLLRRSYSGENSVISKSECPTNKHHSFLFPIHHLEGSIKKTPYQSLEDESSLNKHHTGNFMPFLSFLSFQKATHAGTTKLDHGSSNVEGNIDGFSRSMSNPLKGHVSPSSTSSSESCYLSEDIQECDEYSLISNSMYQQLRFDENGFLICPVENEGNEIESAESQSHAVAEVPLLGNNSMIIAETMERKRWFPFRRSNSMNRNNLILCTVCGHHFLEGKDCTCGMKEI